MTDRPPSVRVNAAVSSPITTNTGAPQGSVISAFLFILYTNACNLNLIDVFNVKYADDTVIVGLITNDDETKYRQCVDEFVNWCHASFLQLNTKKTKVIIFDFRAKGGTHQQTLVNGDPIEIVDEYKYLGTVIDRKLSWDSNTSVIYKKGLQRLYFLRRLRQFRVDRHIMILFYRSFIESVLTFCFVAWFFSLSIVNKNKLNKIVNMSSKIVGQQQLSMTRLCESRVAGKGRAILSDASHPLNTQYEMLPSGRRYRVPLLRTSRAQRSFIPTSIVLLNKQ